MRAGPGYGVSGGGGGGWLNTAAWICAGAVGKRVCTAVAANASIRSLSLEINACIRHKKAIKCIE